MNLKSECHCYLKESKSISTTLFYLWLLSRSKGCSLFIFWAAHMQKGIHTWICRRAKDKPINQNPLNIPLKILIQGLGRSVTGVWLLPRHCVSVCGLREQHELDFFNRTHMIIINSIYLTAHDVSGIGGIDGIGGLSRDNSVIVHRYLPRPSLRRSIKLCWAVMASAATSAQSKDKCVLYVKLLTTEYFIYVAGACDSDRFRIISLGDNNNKLQGYQHSAQSETM